MTIRNEGKQFFVVILIVTMLMAGCVPYRMSHNTQEEEASFGKTQVEINPGYNAMGGNFIQICRGDGSAYVVDEVLFPVDGALHQKIVFYDGGDGDRDFTMLVLVDYEQWEFYADGVKETSYSFTISDQEPIVVDLKIHDIPADARELAIVFFVDTNNMDLSFFDPEKSSRFTGTKYIISQILPINSRPYSFASANMEGESEDNVRMDIGITKSPDEMIVMPNAASGETVWLLVSNTYGTDADVVVSAFCGWEQVNLTPDVRIGHIRLKPGETKRFELTLPVVEDQKPYQLILRDNDCFLHASLRCIISKEEK